MMKGPDTASVGVHATHTIFTKLKFTHLRYTKSRTSSRAYDSMATDPFNGELVKKTEVSGDVPAAQGTKSSTRYKLALNSKM